MAARADLLQPLAEDALDEQPEERALGKILGNLVADYISAEKFLYLVIHAAPTPTIRGGTFETTAGDV